MYELLINVNFSELKQLKQLMQPEKKSGCLIIFDYFGESILISQLMSQEFLWTETSAFRKTQIYFFVTQNGFLDPS